MRRTVSLLVVLLALSFSSTAMADPFSPEMEADYAAAEQYWSRTPTQCSSVTKEQVTGALLDPITSAPLWGWATIPPEGIERFSCIIKVVSGLTSCQTYATMMHEYGHLLGLNHSTDPNNIMYAMVHPWLVCQEEAAPIVPTHHKKFRHSYTIRHSRVTS